MCCSLSLAVFLPFWEVPVITFEDKRTREDFTFLTFPPPICRIYSSAALYTILYESTVCVCVVYIMCLCGILVRFEDLVYSGCVYMCVWFHGWHSVGVSSSEMLAAGLKESLYHGSWLSEPFKTFFSFLFFFKCVCWFW